MHSKQYNNNFRVEVLRRHELNQAFLAQWSVLEDNALEANLFLSQHFILPALHHLTPEVEPLFVAVYLQQEREDKLVALGIFQQNPANRNFPLKHMMAYRCPHKPQSGILVSESYADAAIKAMFGFFKQNTRIWRTVYFVDIFDDGELFKLMMEASDGHAGSWKGVSEKQRSYLPLADGGENYLSEHLPSKRLAEFRRKKRRLSEKGTLEWRCLKGVEVDSQCINDFLKLENAGWKGDQCVSFLSNIADARFFKEMTHEFANTGQTLFTEFRLDDKPIAIICNYISGDIMYTCKQGWDPEYAKFSISMLNMLSLTEYALEHHLDLEYIDSCAVEGSYLDKLWSGRRRLVSGYFSFSRPAKFLLDSVHRVKALKALVRR